MTNLYKQSTLFFIFSDLFYTLFVLLSYFIDQSYIMVSELHF